MMAITKTGKPYISACIKKLENKLENKFQRLHVCSRQAAIQWDYQESSTPYLEIEIKNGVLQTANTCI